VFELFESVLTEVVLGFFLVGRNAPISARTILYQLMFLLKGDCKKIINDTSANGFPNSKTVALVTTNIFEIMHVATK